MKEFFYFNVIKLLCCNEYIALSNFIDPIELKHERYKTYLSW